MVGKREVNLNIDATRGVSVEAQVRAVRELASLGAEVRAAEEELRRLRIERDKRLIRTMTEHELTNMTAAAAADVHVAWLQKLNEGRANWQLPQVPRYPARMQAHVLNRRYPCHPSREVNINSGEKKGSFDALIPFRRVCPECGVPYTIYRQRLAEHPYRIVDLLVFAAYEHLGERT